MAISSDEKYLLNHMNATAAKVQLGTLIENAESVAASEIAVAEGNILVGNSSGVGVALNAKTSGRILVGNGTTVASVAVSGDATLSSAGALTLAADCISSAEIADAQVSLEHLDAGIAPAFVLKFAGEHTTAGGDAAESITATGALATDYVMVNVKTSGTGTRTVMAAAADTDVINVTMSGDPTNDHVLQWFVFRAAA